MARDFAAVKAELDQLTDLIGAAREAVTVGKVIDLQPLEAHVERLCAAVEGADPDERHHIQPTLLSLLSELDALSGAIRDQQGDTARALKSTADTTGKAKAVGAYEKARKPRKR